MNEYKSTEERQFAEWLTEAEAHGLVERWWYEPKKFEIVPRQTYPSGKFAMHPAGYEPDFLLHLTDKGVAAFPWWKTFEDWDHGFGENAVWLEIKGEHDPFRKDDRYVKLKIKLVFHLYKVYVNFTVGSKVFKKTWLPESLWWQKKDTKKPANTKLTRECVRVEEFVGNIKGQQGELL